MEVPGIHYMRTGAIWLIPGILLTIASIAFFNGSGGLIFTGAIVVGGTYLIRGLIDWIHYTVASPAKQSQIHGRMTMTALIRSLCMCTGADGLADEGEIETIIDVCGKVTGTRPATSEVRKHFRSLKSAEGEPWERIAGDGRLLPREEKALIAKACYLLMARDGELTREEDRMLGQILYGLAISRAQALGDLALHRPEPTAHP
jgi:hypothetical protein